MTRRWGRVLVCVAGVVLLVGPGCSYDDPDAESHPTAASTGRSTDSTGSTGSTAAEASPPRPDPLEWQDCDRGLQCSTLAVPVDYDEPDGPSLSLGLVRRPAAKTGERIGSLLVNPGGPGGSAVDFVERLSLPSGLTDRFDIVGLDPRGVGRSNPINCRTHLQEIYTVDPTIEDRADARAILDSSKDFVDECEDRYGDLLPHLGTVNVARDMEQARMALGDEGLTYLGYSYGTAIGQQYARLFPERVRAMVLDGVVAPSQTGLESAEGQAKGFTRALDAFIANCDDNGCGLSGPAGAVIDDVIAASERDPIRAPGSDRPATPGVVSLALGQALYTETYWPQLARALDDAEDGNGDGLVRLADDYLGRDPDGTYPNGFEVYFAVSCLDSEWPSDPDTVFAAGKRVGTLYPRLGEAIVNDYVRCAMWPVPPEPLDPVPSTIEGLPSIVVLSTTGDPATPYSAGVQVAEQIPDARLITNVGEGHTIFAGGKSCIDDPVVDYLVDLTAPVDGLRCE